MAGGGVLVTAVPHMSRVFAFSIPPTRLLIVVVLVVLPVAAILMASLKSSAAIWTRK
jgi:hypothetical protein